MSELSKVIAERERGGGRASQRYEPSAKASSAMMPFRPESTNPLKVLEGGDWSLYVVDMVSIETLIGDHLRTLSESTSFI